MERRTSLDTRGWLCQVELPLLLSTNLLRYKEKRFPCCYHSDDSWRFSMDYRVFSRVFVCL